MQLQVDNLSAALSVLSAMITPAVLIGACGSLIIATSNRVGRVIDRTRYLSDQFEKVARESDRTLLEEERTVLFDQLNRAVKRSRMLQRAMARLYMALSVFVATSVAIGIVAVTSQAWSWVPLILGLAGAAFLFNASVLLILESRIALASIYDEMDFLLLESRHYAPRELREGRRTRTWRPGGTTRRERER